MRLRRSVDRILGAFKGVFMRCTTKQYNSLLKNLGIKPSVCTKDPNRKVPDAFKHILAGYRTIGGQKVYFRSKWEANYARYLEFLIKDGSTKSWEYEPKLFWFKDIKRGVRCYKPDFRVTTQTGKIIWVEVKGYMDARSKTKISRFRKYYPNEFLMVVDGDWFKKNNPIFRNIIKDWE